MWKKTERREKENEKKRMKKQETRRI